MKHPVGNLEDVLIKVGYLYMPIDFVILEMDEDIGTPIILRRSFLATTRYHLDVKNKLSFDVEEEHLEFNLIKASKFPSTSG